MEAFLTMALASALVLGSSTRSPSAGVSAWCLAPEPGHGPLFDVRDDAIWVCGDGYKAGFDARGVQFVPFLGSDAPRNFPVAFALREVRVGGEPLAFATDVAPRRDGSTISFDRGSFVELYRAEPDSLEQLFRFDALPRAGELVLRIAYDSDLAAHADAAGIRFGNERGGARYGKATVIDARGRSADAPAALDAGGLEIRVGAEFLARAVFPVTVDPLVTSFTIDASPADDRAPDVAYDASLDLYLVCWERVFSASDSDVLAKLVDAGGNSILQFAVDATPGSRTAPVVACIKALDRFLVAMTVGQQGNCESRLVDLAGGGLSVGPPVTQETWGHARGVDLGGDSGDAPPYDFCLVRGDDFGGCQGWSYRIIDQDGQPGPSGGFGDCKSELYAQPRVSKSAGEALGGVRTWRAAVQVVGPHPGDPDQVLSIRIAADGTWDSAVTLATGSGVRPEGVSSYLDGASGEQPAVVVWSQPRSSGPDRLFASLVQGTHADGGFEIGADPSSVEYASADADSDGSNFVVSYTARRTPGLNEIVYADTFALQDSTLALRERTRLSGTNSVRSGSAICSTRSGGGAPRRFAAVWQALAADGDVEGALYDTLGPGIPYCTSAPNSVGPGASIGASGSISIALDDFGLSATGCPPNRPGIFYLGLNQIELPFGEGFRCIGGATRRITPILTTDAMGNASLLLDFDQPYGQLVQPGAPGVNYQFWYRDPAGGPSHFNLSDALHVEHTP